MTTMFNLVKSYEKNYTPMLIAIVSLMLIAIPIVQAQTDLTHLISNPSFETGNTNGWTWTGASGYGWLGPNTDGDNTKDGSFIGGIWNGSIGDCELAQTITDLPAGYYQLRCLMTVSHNKDNSITTQRLFLESDGLVASQLYGAATETAYSEENLNILGSSESYSFGNNETSSAENGPFKEMRVVKHVTDGTATIGIRVNGKSSALGYDFSYTTRGDAGFFKFDHFRLYEVSKVATLDHIALSEGMLDELYSPEKTEHTATLPAGTTQVKPVITPSVDGQTITGDGTIDVSSGTGKSVIKVQSIDGSTDQIYTINYTVLEQAPESIVTFLENSTGVDFELVDGFMRVQICNDNIVRVGFCRNDTLPKKESLAVNNNWDLPAFTVGETDSTVIITTTRLDISVEKANSRVSYFDKSGNLILSEYSKSVDPVTISPYAFATNTCRALFNSPENEALYGLGQHQQGSMNYKGKTQTLDQQNGEIALPFLVSNIGYGLLWDNYSESIFTGNEAGNTRYAFTSESGEMVDYYFIYGPTIDETISGYRTATGTAPLFPKWAYGLFQSKDKYTTADELLKMANDYREAQIPVDCIVQDWDYWTPDFWGSNTVNGTRYPDPKATIDSMHSMNLHTMISIWPVFHKNTNNFQEYDAIGALYPSNGDHHFYDPHNTQARSIYWNQVNSQLFSKHGWDAWWADNNEPQGWPDGFDRKNYTTALGSGITYYNSYPITHVAGVYEGWRKDIPEKRAFILSRSAFSGQQRYAAASWSGDIQSNWTDFKRQLSAGLNFCLSGIPYWTTDIGGYFGTDWSTADNNELMVRWFQYGTFTPLYRIHGKGDKSMVSNHNLSGNSIQIMTTFDQLRYRLMPYIYSLGWKVTNEDYTIMRHLIMEYQNDDKVKNIADQFFFGPNMMINPITSLGQRNRTVYLPEGEWYDFWTGTNISGAQTVRVDAPLDRIPIYVKAGAIIPMGPQIQHANETADPIELRVYRGADGQFTIYEDAGEGYNYEHGEYSTIPLTYNDALQQLIIGVRSGSFPGMLDERKFKIVWVDEYYGAGVNVPVTCDTTIQYNGSEIIINYNADFAVPTLHYEAEDATLAGISTVNSAQSNYSGTGYVEGMNAKTSAVLFQVETPTAGIYQINMRYSAGYEAKKQALSIFVDDQKIQTLQLNPTRNAATWGNASFVAPLDSGAVTLKFGGDSTFVDLDCIDLSLSSKTPYFQITSKKYHIRPLNSDLYLNSSNGHLQLTAKDTIQSQIWEIEKAGENVYIITSVSDGKSLTVDQESTDDRASITSKFYNAEACQEWHIDALGAGVHLITASHSHLVMSSTTQGRLEQQSDVAGGFQRWIFEEVPKAVLATAVHEPFDYEQNKELNGLGEAGHGWGGAWVVYEGSGEAMTIDSPLAFPGLKGLGNSLTGNLTYDSELRSYRTLDPKFEDEGNDIWVSFLLQIDNPNSLANSWQGLSLFNGSEERVLIGKDWEKLNLGFNGSNVGSFISSTSAFSGELNWLVFKIETSGDVANENAYLWLNPDPAVEPNTSSSDVSGQVQINGGFDRIVCHLGNTAGISSSFDEIRLGYSFNQVTQPETVTTIQPQTTNGEYFRIHHQGDELVIAYGSSTDSDAQLRLLNMNGTCLYHKNLYFEKGIHRQSVDLGNLSLQKGVYIVSIINEDGAYSQKIIR